MYPLDWTSNRARLGSHREQIRPWGIANKDVEKDHWTGVCAVFEVVATFRVKSPVGSGNKSSIVSVYANLVGRAPRHGALCDGTCGYGLTGLIHALGFLEKGEILEMAATLTRSTAPEVLTRPMILSQAMSWNLRFEISIRLRFDPVSSQAKVQRCKQGPLISVGRQFFVSWDFLAVGLVSLSFPKPSNILMALQLQHSILSLKSKFRRQLVSDLVGGLFSTLTV